MAQRVYRYKAEQLFTEQEIAIIWDALDKYDVGPKEANPKLYEKLELIRQNLVDFFS